MPASNHRLSGIDLIRSCAILIMLIANTLPYGPITEHPSFLRLLCSLAAPLFIFLSGYSVHLSRERQGWTRYQPALAVLLAAIFVDITAWSMLPFLGFDVLYLISFGLFINTALRLRPTMIMLLATFFLIVGTWSMNYLPYRFHIDEIVVSTNLQSIVEWWSQKPWYRMLLDGWFPVIPWVGFSLLGNAFGHYEKKFDSHRKTMAIAALSIFLLLCIFRLSNPMEPLRNGYVEIFYPLSLTQVLLSICWVVFFTLSLSRISQNIIPMNLITVIGRKSQLVYIIHAILIGRLISSKIPIANPTQLSFVIASLIFVSYLVGYLAETSVVSGYSKRLPPLMRRTLGL